MRTSFCEVALTQTTSIYTVHQFLCILHRLTMLSHVASMRALQGVQSMMRNAMGSTQVALGSNISGGSMGKAWADKEHAQENQYFSKQDAQNLAKLAEKLHLQTAVSTGGDEIIQT